MQDELDELKRLTKLLGYQRKLAKIIEAMPNAMMYQEVALELQEITGSEFALVGYMSADKTVLICPSLGLPMMMSVCSVGNQDIRFTVEQLKQMSHWGRFWLGDLTPIYDNNPGNFSVPTGHIPVKNFLLVPIRFRGELIGAIALANRIPVFNDDILHIVIELSEYIAPVLVARLERDRITELLEEIQHE